MSKIFTKVIVHTVSDYTNHYWLSEIFTNFDTFLILFLLNALLSLFLTAYHYSHRYQSQCHRKLPNLNVPYFEWHWMSSLDIYICQPQTWSHQDSQALGILLGLPHLDFNQVLWHEGTVCPVYLPLFHSQYASMAICSRNGFSCLNCGISRVLESCPFWCELLMHLCMAALWLFNKDEVCWHILLTPITYLPLQKRCVECSSFKMFP